MTLRARSLLCVTALLVVACSADTGDPGVGDTPTSSSTLTTWVYVTSTTGSPATSVAPPATGPSTTTITSTTELSTTTSLPVTTSTRAVPAGWASGTVTRVVDGDTIEVHFESGTTETVRLIGTNSPEGGECFADEAAIGLAGVVDGQTVYLETDVSDRDQFGRLLRYVWTAGEQLVNEISVAEGWALAREYPPDTARSDQLESAQGRASSSGSGLWAPDACGAPNPSDVRIVHVEYDADGNDNFNLNGEWVEIRNADDVPVDLTGWLLKDESSTHRYSFPSGFILEPASSARVFTGCGTDTAETLYWCVSGSAVWNNTGDTAFLLDPDGNIVYSSSYG